MRIVVISDLHGLCRKMEHPIPEGDVLIVAGDITNCGELYQLENFNYWLSELPHTHKCIIAGNHDWCFDNFQKSEAKSILTDCIYLENSEVIIDGIKFYGSPISPFFMSWAFNMERGERIKKYWDAIPYDTNVLITHGPVYNILDNIDGQHVGCVDLRKRVLELPMLKVHICGHIHDAYGTKKYKGIQFVNASICTEQYKPINKPIVIDI
jgi:Icc-related predicted phosphoesterase